MKIWPFGIPLAIGMIAFSALLRRLVAPLDHYRRLRRCAGLILLGSICQCILALGVHIQGLT